MRYGLDVYWHDLTIFSDYGNTVLTTTPLQEVGVAEFPRALDYCPLWPLSSSAVCVGGGVGDGQRYTGVKHQMTSVITTGEQYTM